MGLPSVIESPLNLFTSNWATFGLDLYHKVSALLKHESHEGLYELLEYDAVLELLDRKGRTAIFKKRLRVKFIQDDVITFQDHAWGDGDILAEYGCSPGIDVDRYPEGDRWNVLISLRETKSRGEVEDFYIQRKIHHGFPRKEEWWQIEMQYQTRHLKFAVKFPPGRHCSRAVLIERKRNRSTLLGPQHFVDLPDGQRILTWENAKPRRFETYTIKWQW
jgi:hypothetical protein